MKQCPQCKQACEEQTVVCPNCGYLFSATGEDHAMPVYPAAQGGDGMALASLVLGIIGIVLAIFVIGVIPAVVGLVLGIVSAVSAHREKRRAGQAVAGIILSVVAIALSAALIAFVIYLRNDPSFMAKYQQILQQYSQQTGSAL